MEKVILVTGGSRGLGACLVNALSGAGRLPDDPGLPGGTCLPSGSPAENPEESSKEKNIVVFTYVNSQESASRLEAGSQNVHAVRCDQKEESQVRQCYEAVLKEYGRLDILINNACSSFRPCDLLASDWSLFQEMLDTCLKGAWLHTKEAAGIMERQGSGRIINVLTSYVFNIPPEKLSFYVTAKYALLGFTKSAAVELAKYGITVNAVSPGLMETDLSGYLPRKYLEVYAGRHPMKRLTKPQDVADAVAFLISDGAAFLNGVNIPVNGGEAF